MSAEALRAELMGVPGVASAEVDESGGNPSGVKVQLSAGADARRVGVAVQRILAAHGMRSRFTDEPDPGPPATPPPVAATPAPPLSPPPQEPAAAPPPPREPAVPAPEPPAPEPPAPEAAPATPAPEVPEAPPVEPPQQAAAAPPEPAPEVSAAATSPGHPGQAPPTMTVVPSPPSAAPPAAPPRLQSVALEERADGLTAVVSLANGRTGSRDVAMDMDDLDDSVVAAFSEAAGRSVEIVGVDWAQYDGESVVTVVVREDSALRAGAAVMRAGRAFAVAAATRAALEV